MYQRTKTFVSIIFALLMVTSMVAGPAVASTSSTTSAAPSNNINHDISGEQNVDSTSSTTSETTTDSSTESTSSSSQIAYTPQNLEDQLSNTDDYTVQKKLDGMNVSYNLSDWGNVDGGVLIEDITVEGTPPSAYYPYKHPVTVVVRAYDPSTGDLVAKDVAQVTLRPRTDNDKSYTAELSASMVFQQSGATEYRFEVESQMQEFNVSSGVNSKLFTVTGTNDQTETNISARIQDQDQFRQLPTTETVQSYKASETDPSYREDTALPTYNLSEISGNVSNFAYMTEDNDKSATFESENGSMSITTNTQYIEPNEPQTIAIRSAVTGSGDTIEVIPIDGKGREIDPNTTYTISRNTQSECIDGSVTSVCLFELSQEEKEFINDQGELFLAYHSDKQTSAEILCQEIISGGLRTVDTACGLSETQSSGIYGGAIEQLDLVQADGTFENNGKSVDTSLSALSDKELGIQVRNTGSDPIPADEPIFLFSNSNPNLSTAETSTYTSGTDFSATPNEESFTASFSNSQPASTTTLEVDATTNDGSVEVLVEDGSGNEVYRELQNTDGTSTIDLSGLGGYNTSYTVTLNAVYNSNETAPVVDEVRLISTDEQSKSDVVVKVGNMSGGSGDLAPGESRTHQFTSIDLQTLADPGSTFRAKFTGTTLDFKVTTGDGKIVADAGGPYQVTLGVDGYTREQVGVTTERETTKPGPDWTQGDAVGTSDGTEEWVTKHEKVPEVDGLTAKQAVAYYEKRGYIPNPRAQLPENTRSEWEVAGIRYTNYRGQESFHGLENTLDNAEGSYNPSDVGWQRSSYSGETITSYSFVESTYFQNSDGDLQFDVDNSNAVYFPEDPDTKTNTTNPVVLKVIEQSESPVNSDGIDNSVRCENTTNEYPCWRKGDYIQTERDTTTGDYVDYKCQSLAEYYDPGPDWYLLESGAGVCGTDGYFYWGKIGVNEERDIYEWELVDTSKTVNLHIPNIALYDEYTRDQYDVEVVWERSTTSGATVYEWTGPEWRSTPDTGTDSLRLDGSKSQSKSDVKITEYEWEVNGERYTGPSPEITLDATGEYNVELVVRSEGGLSARDTTHIDAISTCTDLLGCDGSVRPSIDIGKYTERTDLKYGETNFEILANGGAGSDGSDYQIVVTPAESVLRVQSDEPCPEGYYRADGDILNKIDYDVEFYSVQNGVQVDQEDRFCVKDSSNDSGGPPIFEHPDALQGVDVREFELNDPSAESVVWKGDELPAGGLTTMAHINPRMNKAISPTYQEYTIEIRPQGSDFVYDSETITVQYCVADNGVYRCPDFDSDLDATADSNDDCPYTPLFDTEPCYLYESPNIEQQDIWFGRADDDSTTPDWQLDKKTMHIVTQPAHTNSEKVYNPSTLELGTEIESPTGVNSGLMGDNAPLIAYHTFDDQWPRDSNGNIDYTQTTDIFTFTEEEGSDHAVGYSSRNYDQNVGGSEYTKITLSGQVVHTFDEKVNFDTSKITVEEKDAGYKTYYNKDGVGQVLIDKQVTASYTNTSTTPTASDYSGTTVTRSVDTGPVLEQSGPLGNSVHIQSETWVAAASYTSPPDTNNDLNAEVGNALYPSSGDGISIGFWFRTDFDNTDEQVVIDTTQSRPLIVGTTEGQRIEYPVTTAQMSFRDGILYYTTQDDEEIILDVPANGRADSVSDYAVRDYEAIGENSQPLIDLSYEKNAMGSVEFVSLDSSERATIGDDSSYLGDRIEHKYVASGDQLDLNKVQNLNVESAQLTPRNVSAPLLIIRSHQTMQDVKLQVGQDQWQHGVYTASPKSEEYSAITFTHSSDQYDSTVTTFNYTLDSFDPDKNLEIVKKNGKYQTYYLERDSNGNIESRMQIDVRDADEYSNISKDNYYHEIYDSASESGSMSFYINGGDPRGSGTTPQGVVPYNPTKMDSTNTENIQLFYGAGYSYEGGWFTWGSDATLNKFFEGEIADVTIQEHTQAGYEMVDNAYQVEGKATTDVGKISDSDIQEAIDDPELTKEDIAYTKENTKMATNINWGGGQFSSYPAEVTVTLVPTDENGNVMSNSGFYQKVYNYDPTGTQSTLTSSGPTGKVSKITKTVNNNLDPNNHYYGFKATVEIDVRNGQEGISSPQVEDIQVSNYNPNTPSGSYKMESSTLETSGANNEVPSASDSDGDGEPDGDGGGVHLKGQISDTFSSPQNLTGKFIVRDNNTVIAEKTFSTQDTKTITADVSWADLKALGLESRDTEYEVIFVIEAHPEGYWERKEIGTGTFIMCGDNSSVC